MQDVAALIARPRRFGKTLNMTMLREFFDISRDSRDLFKGLAIMDTEYANQINYGVQRVAKESIFSQFNNPQVYTVIDREYAPYFGLNESETRTLLEAYGYELSEDVRRMYDGYQIGGTGIYNPWSVICHAKKAG